MRVMSKDEFEKLVDGLLYTSETDAPLTYLELNRCKQDWDTCSVTLSSLEVQPI
jgi:hypothetical protein